jgi:hypothetical protein
VGHNPSNDEALLTATTDESLVVEPLVPQKPGDHAAVQDQLGFAIALEDEAFRSSI